MKTCLECDLLFEITDTDRAFYQKMEVPGPHLCPPCRQQRRAAWANQTNLYKRKCDATGEMIVSHYHPDAPVKVYSRKAFINDDFDATEYDRDFDFERPFFEQWAELSAEVPRPALHGALEFNENSDYVNYAGFNKDCYMIFDADYNESCYYSVGLNKSKMSADLLRSKECELCYECVDCFRSYRLLYSQDCDNCSDSAFLKNCVGVRNSFMCSNLKNKEYYIFNKPYDKETYERLMNSLSDQNELAKYLKDWEAFKLNYPQKYTHGVQNENVIGDYLINSKDTEYGYDAMELWNCKYIYRSFGDVKDSMDCDEIGTGAELLYECSMSGFNFQNSRFNTHCWNQISDLDYSVYCNSSKYLFACISLNRKEYCILNKQYTKEEYERLVPKIIEHMKRTGEWGEFFPVELSDQCYNETIAQEDQPLSKEEVLRRGWKWRDKDDKEYSPATAQIPEDSRNAEISICQEVFACEGCGKNYKLIEQEFKLYKTLGVPMPRHCFHCRHQSRFALRNPRMFFDRQCDKCQISINTTYSPERPEMVYCEACYLESMH